MKREIISWTLNLCWGTVDSGCFVGESWCNTRPYTNEYINRPNWGKGTTLQSREGVKVCKVDLVGSREAEKEYHQNKLYTFM